MSEELMPCPVCGGPVGVGWETESQGQAVECSTDLSPWHYKVAGSDYADAVAQHNTLARRAEIGRLVESMAVNGCSVCLWESIDSQGPSQYTAEFRGDRDPIFQYGATLLDALRSLAAELEVSGE